MSVTSRRRHVPAALFATVLMLVPPMAAAQYRLPWADANPLEQWFGKPGEQRRAPPRAAPSRATAKSKALPAVPTVAAVPVPEPAVRPTDPAATPSVPAADTGDQAGASMENQSSSPPLSPVARTERDESAPKPVRENETPATEGRSETSGADSQGETAPPPATPDSADPLRGATAPSEPEEDVPATADPAAAASKPIAEIPVPEIRPADAPAVQPDPPTPPPAAGEAGPVDAPNSTEALKSRKSEISPATAVIAAAAIEDAELCETELRKRGVAFTVGDSISEGDCGVLRPLSVTELSSGVVVSPQTQLLCRTALALDDWMSASVVPAAKATLPDHALTEFRHASTYVCRPRASENGISEHARGSAVDIAAFVFEGRDEIGIAAQAPGTPEAAFQARVRAGACGPFRTVLGPGTDADHDTHFHLDIAARRNGATYCK